MASSSIPITVFTGFLGSGKTSIILGLLPRFPKDYKVVLLKNEFGDVEVDSQLAKQSSLTAVSEILNGCMCCVLVGQMKTAILEIRERYRPDRIIIETSGSAFPATLAFQIRELERETKGDIKLDAILTVIDAENFTGYEDTSSTARMQAQYSDVLLINKWEHISERALDVVMDHLYTLNEYTPKIKCVGRSVDPSLVLGLDSKLFLHHSPHHGHEHEHEHEHEHGHGHEDLHSVLSTHHDEVETVTITRTASIDASTAPPLTRTMLESSLDRLPKESVYRVKGFIRFADSTDDSTFILNWAFGRFELTTLDPEGPKANSGGARLTMMGERGEIKVKWARRFAQDIGGDVI